MEIKKVGVIGAGAMGSGIAQLFAQNGFEVTVRDIKQEFVDRGLGFIDGTLGRSVSKGKMSEDDKAAIMGRLSGTVDMSALKDMDFVVEAAIEDISLKQDIFKELDGLTGPDVILATNTSSLAITEIAAATKRPDKVVGMHFFNPAPIMKLVEIIKGHLTSDDTAGAVQALAEKMGKVTVLVNKDEAGFIVNRMMIPQLMEAIKIYDEGIASKEDIDKAMKFGLNHPMGPFELMDFTGIDICYFVNEVFKKELPREVKHTTPYSLRATVRAGRLGRKTGAGWYDYSKK